MTDSPDTLRDDIERTRADLGADVDALADKVTPSKIAHRQADRVRSALGSVRDHVMGVADEAGSAVSDVADGAAGAVHDVKRKAEGNPLAVGLIAFGAGLLLASLIPATEKEKSLAEEVKQKAQPLVNEVTDMAKDIAEDLKEPAQEAVSAVTNRAAQAVDHVKVDASDATEAVKDRAQEAQQNISDS